MMVPEFQWKDILKRKSWRLNRKEYKENIDYDIKIYLSWGKKDSMAREIWNSPEWKYIRCFRKAKACRGSVWHRFYYKPKLERLTRKTGIWIPDSIEHIGKGLTIGHWGRIVVNPRTIIGDDFFISFGCVIGRDIRGKRAGAPVIGDRVCLKTNVTIVGKVTIGNDVLFAPSAYCNFDVPSHSIVVGNPGRIFHRDNATEGYLGVVND